VALATSQDSLTMLEPARADGAAEQIDGLAEHRGILAAMKVIRNDELRNANNSLEFEGADHGGEGVSFFLLDAAPGRGPSLHTHEYAEVFIVLEGQATFRGPDGEREIGGGHVVVVPPGEPHAFVNSGDGPLRQVNIHASSRFVTEWLEEEDYG
jgi:mannose-6-phosphate isomerase-like protein (cupin superfamily)